MRKTVIIFVVIVLLFVLSIFVFSAKNSPQTDDQRAEEILQSIIDQQSNTLTITAICVSVIALYSLISNHYKDERIEKLVDDINKKNQEITELQKEAKTELESLKFAKDNLWALNMVVTSNYEYQTFQLKTLEKLARDTNNINVCFALVELYERELKNNDNPNHKIEILNKIIDFLETIEQNELTPNEKDSINIRLAISSAKLGQIYWFSYNTKSQAEDRLNKAIVFCNKVSSKDVHVKNRMALSKLWLYQVTKEKDLLDQAAFSYRYQILSSSSLTHLDKQSFSTNYAAVLINKARDRNYNITEKERALSEAKETLDEVLKYNKNNINANLNLADIELHELLVQCRINDFSELYEFAQREKSFPFSYEEFQEKKNTALSYLNRVKTINPLKENSYTKEFQFNLIELVFLIFSKNTDAYQCSSYDSLIKSFGSLSRELDTINKDYKKHNDNKVLLEKLMNLYDAD